MATEVKRAVRVAQRLREELAALVGRDLRDPRVAGVVIARVEMTDDLRRAKVYFRLLEGGDDEARRALAGEGLTRAGGMLRREATQRLQLRSAPELVFFYDATQEKLQRIEELLHEVREESKKRD